MDAPPIAIIRRPLRGGLLGVWDRLTGGRRPRLEKAVPVGLAPADASTMLRRGAYTIRAPTSVGQLQWMYMESAVVRTVIQTVVAETWRAPLVVAQEYAAKCTACGYEDEDDYDGPICPECAGQMKQPAGAIETTFADLLKVVNPNGQTLEDVLRSCDVDVLLGDDAYIRFVFDYVTDIWGGVTATRCTAMYRVDPKAIEFCANESEEIGGLFETCLIHRSVLLPAGTGKGCPTCGGKLHDVKFIAYDRYHEGAEANKHAYIEGEILHWSEARPGPTYGFSRLVSVWLQANTLRDMDLYQSQIYEGGQPPKGLLIFQSDNPDTVDSKWRLVEEKLRQNPKYVPTFAVKHTGQGPPVIWQPIDLNLTELQTLEARKELRERIASIYGVSNLQMADNAEAGGLHNDTQQQSESQRRIESRHNVYRAKVFPPILKAWGLDGAGWKYDFPPVQEEEEEAVIRRAGLNIDNAQKMQALGYEVDLEDQDTMTFRFSKTSPYQARPMVPGASIFGAPAGPHPVPVPGASVFGTTTQPQEEPAEVPGASIFLSLTKATPGDGFRNAYEQAFTEFNRAAKATTDPAKLREALNRTIDRMTQRMGTYRYQAYAELLGQGLRAAGLDPGKLRISPQEIELLADRNPLWEAYEGLSRALSQKVNEIMGTALLRPGGFSPPELRAQMADAWDAEEYRIERIIRTENAAVVNQGMALGFEQIQKPDWRYVWSGPDDSRTTDACEWLKKTTERAGGVTLEELRGLVDQARARWFPGLEPREMLPHINCRHEPRKLVRSRKVAKADFKETEHPRENDGKFTDKPGDGGAKEPQAKKPEGPKSRPAVKPNTKASDAKKLLSYSGGERVANLSSRYKLANIGMAHEMKQMPGATRTDDKGTWAKVQSRFASVKDKIGTAWHPSRFPVDIIDDKTKTCWEIKTYSEEIKDMKIKSGHDVDRERKALVAKTLGYDLKTRLLIVDRSGRIKQVCQKDGFGGWRPHQMDCTAVKI